MAKSRLGLTARDLQSKPAALCIVFLLVYFWRSSDQKKVQEEIRRELNASAGKPKRSAEPGVSTIMVPYKDGLAEQRVEHISPKRFHDDYRKFSRSRRSFGKEISAILSILVPSFKTKVIRHLILHMAMLAFRTYMSLIVADLDGRIVRHLIGANGPAFAAGLVEWLALAVPASYTNATIKYLEGKISLDFRTALVRYIHDLYVGAGMEYYKLSSIDGALEGVDHYITTDVTKFCSAAAKVYSNIGKPSLDLFIFSVQLSRNLGRKTMLGIFVNYFVTAAVLRALSPAFGKLAARETQLEGEFRNAHARVITNAEEIAFYDGAAIEKKSLGHAYRSLVDHVANVMKVKALYSVIEGYVLKYSWSASGYLFASVPVFFPHVVKGYPSSQISRRDERDNMGKFITNKRIMLSISDAGGRIMYSIKDTAELAGYTRRVYQLIAALHRVRRNAYGGRRPDVIDEKAGHYTLANVHGKLEVSNDLDIVKFEDVPVVVPGSGVDNTNGELLLNPLRIEILPGQHLLIVGSNGTGKSSIARLAAGLWPVYAGLLKRSKNVSFLPQRPYFSWGTLRDQIIYPFTHEQMLRVNVKDSDLMDILSRVNLAYLPEREGGLDVVKEWKDVFSGGEKQRMLFARLLFARPKFAVIDEGTSAVSVDMEGQLYDELKARGITLITISHRLSLLKYHGTKLEVGLGDDGMDWTFESTSHEHGWKSMDKEIEEIKRTLEKIPELKKRREEIIELLKC